MALFCYVFAKQHGGEFILRIEDTDAARSSRASEQLIIDSLTWLGLAWDEGPDVGGPHAPYRQSERVAQGVYKRYAEQLVTQGDAFHCFCSADRLSKMRAEQVQKEASGQYDGRCLALTHTEVAKKIKAGEPNVIRMHIPKSGVCVIPDKLRGNIEIEWSQIDMQILVKEDGNPTYHLAVVVDDHLMEISHIIRGEEWINSVPKAILLHEYFGWQMPELIHMPLLRNADKSKLSKRKNPTSIIFYERMGFLPEALLNYLGMLGWSMPNGEEQFSLDEMISSFDIRRISLGAPVFDVDKLKWLNGRWLREKLPDEEVVERMVKWAFNRDNLLKIMPLLKKRLDVFSDFASKAGFFVEGMPALLPADFAMKTIAPNDVVKVLQYALWQLEVLEEWRREPLHNIFTNLAEKLDMKIRDVLAPVFIAVTGKPVSPPLFDSMEILGSDMTRGRIRHALKVTGGISKKQLKKLEKEYRQLFR